MKETLLLTADWHFTDNQKDNYRWQLFPYLEDMIQVSDVDRLIVLGDLTEKKNNHNSFLVNRIVDGIEQLSKLCYVNVLMGNHDGTNLNNPYFRFLDKMPNVSFITEPFKDGDYLFLPHTKSPDKDWKDLKFDSFKYCFMHQLFQGAVLSDKYKSEHGAAIDYVTSFKWRNFSGDVHIPQDVGNAGQGIITYIGSPYSIDFGDHFDGRVIILKDGKEISLHPNFLKKWSIKIEDVGELEQFEFGKADQVKIQFNLHPHDFHRVNELRKVIREYCINKKVDLCSLSMKPIKTQKRLRLNKSKEYMKKMSSADVVKQFARKEKLSDKQLEVGLDLLK